MKKLSIFLLALVACAGTMLASDTKVGGIWYNFDNGNLTAEVTFRGVHQYYYSNEYTGDVVIPASVSYNAKEYSVTSIGEYAFSDCSGLTSVTIGNSVTSIGESAFQNCTGLTSVEIPNSVISIGEDAFRNCSGLTSVTIPNSITSIGGYAFAVCTGLTSLSVEAGNTVYDSRNSCNAIIETSTNTLIFGCQNTTIPNTVTSIGDYAFEGCSSLTSVTIPNSVTSIGNRAFFGCSSLTSVTIPNSVTSIGDDAFWNCTGLTSVTIPNSVTSIGYGAFSGCSGLTSVTIGNSVTSIGSSAFSGCSGLTSVTIPNSVTSIGDYAFYSCSGLTSVTIEAETPPSLGSSAFANTNNCPIYVPCGTLETYQSTWTSYSSQIEYEPLKYIVTGKVNIVDAGSVQLPPTNCREITAIPNYGYHFAQWSDGDTNNPRTIEVTQDTTFQAIFAKNVYTIAKQCDVAQGTIEGAQQAMYLDDVTLTANANYGYHFVQWSDGNIDNPRSFVLTQDTTFQATFAKNVYSITKNAEHGSIEGNASAEYLDEVTLTVSFDYGYHFTQWSDSVTDNPRIIVLTQDTTFTAEFAVDTIGTCGDDNLLTWEFAADTKTLTISGEGTLNSNYTFGLEAPSNIQTLLIQNGVTSLGNSAFANEENIVSLSLPNGLTAIGDSTFINCKKLKKLTIPSSVTTIGKNAFSNGNRLETIILGEGIETIDVNAFANCPYILSVYAYMEYPPVIDASVFAGCGDLSYVDLYVLEDSYARYRKTAVWNSFNLKTFTPTSVDQVPSDQVQCTKVLRDGQIFILRGEKVYNAQGVLVK